MYLYSNYFNPKDWGISQNKVLFVFANVTECTLKYCSTKPDEDHLPCSTGSVDGEEGDVSQIQPQVYTYLCDVSKREEVYLTADKVQREVGNIDILINNAGVVSGRHLLECPDELLERTMMVNCHAHFWVSCIALNLFT